MSKLRFYAAMTAAKCAHLGLRMLGRNATYLPGKIALKLCPDFMGHLQKPKTVICVTGTNGKTTVSNLLNSLLTQCGYDVLNNSLGSNVQAGVCCALMSNSKFGGKPKKDTAVLEVDERSSLLIYPYLTPDYLICNNIMRDSIKRNAHTDFISYVISTAVPKETKLILNADDIICSHLCPDIEDRTYFGISAEKPDVNAPAPYLRDIVYCPECGTKLESEYLRYNHIGRTSCPKCGYGTPAPDFCVTEIDREANTFTVTHDGKDEKFELINGNITNLYNFCAVITLANKLGIPYEKLSKTFAGLEIVKTRFDETELNGRKLTVILAKGQNPIAVSGVINYVSSYEEQHKSVILTLDDIEDNHNDSENTAWIFDTDYRGLRDPSIDEIIFVGKRAGDYRLHALITGVDEKRLKTFESWQDGVAAIDLEHCRSVYLLHDVYRNKETELMKAAILKRMEGMSDNDD